MERSYIGSILCLPTASALPNWLERRLRYVSVLWAALRQATACLQDTYGCFRGKSQATPAAPIAPRPSLVRLKVERKDLAWVPVPPRAGRYLIITLRFLLTLSVGFSCLFRQPECS